MESTLKHLLPALLLSANVALAAPPPSAAEPLLQICVQHVRTRAGEIDFREAFARGPIRIPAGVVFDLAGPAFGPAHDTRDQTNQPPSGTGWTGVDEAENNRRAGLIANDLRRSLRNSAALVTLAEIRLTRTAPCADAPVAAAQSDDWGWKRAPVIGAPDFFYEAHGVVRGPSFRTNWIGTPAAFRFVAERGELHGILRGTTNRTVSIPPSR